MAVLTVQELASHLQIGIASSEDVASATAAIADASGIINSYCGRKTAATAWTTATVPAAVKAVAKRVAARIFDNPRQRTSYTGPDGLNYAGGPARILTDDEREQLNEYVVRHRRVGSITMAQAPWSTPGTS